MTQPRVVLFYLSQLFYPIPTRLSIFHDFEISRSFLEPWTTLPAFLSVLGLIVYGFLCIRKQPLLCFSILFFFLNHIVESSVIGLELVFEHRNYLPSLFLFVPVAAWLHALYERYRVQRSDFRFAIIGFVVLWVGGLCSATYIRTLAWSDAKTFWEDAAEKAPLSMRPLHNLAFEYYEKRGQFKEAFDLYSRSLKLRDYNCKGLGIAHNNIANYHYLNGDFEKAKEHLDIAVAASPDVDPARFFRAFILLKARKPEEAMAALAPLLRKHPKSLRYNHLAAQILLELNRIEEALASLQTCLLIAPDSAEALDLIGVAMNLKRDRDSAAGPSGP
jgi:protein O-mannosyl-transferase